MCHRTRNIASPVWIRTCPDHQEIGIDGLGHQHRPGVSLGKLQLPTGLRRCLLEDAPDASPVRATHHLFGQSAVLIDLHRSERLDPDRPVDHVHRAYGGTGEPGLPRAQRRAARAVGVSSSPTTIRCGSPRRPGQALVALVSPAMARARLDGEVPPQ